MQDNQLPLFPVEYTEGLDVAGGGSKSKEVNLLNLQILLKTFI